jgi:hypothetical protein
LDVSAWDNADSWALPSEFLICVCIRRVCLHARREKQLLQLLFDTSRKPTLVSAEEALALLPVRFPKLKVVDLTLHVVAMESGCPPLEPDQVSSGAMNSPILSTMNTMLRGVILCHSADTKKCKCKGLASFAPSLSCSYGGDGLETSMSDDARTALFCKTTCDPISAAKELHLVGTIYWLYHSPGSGDRGPRDPALAAPTLWMVSSPRFPVYSCSRQVGDELSAAPYA